MRKIESLPLGNNHIENLKIKVSTESPKIRKYKGNGKIPTVLGNRIIKG